MKNNIFYTYRVIRFSKEGIANHVVECINHDGKVMKIVVSQTVYETLVAQSVYHGVQSIRSGYLIGNICKDGIYEFLFSDDIIKRFHNTDAIGIGFRYINNKTQDIYVVRGFGIDCNNNCENVTLRYEKCALKPGIFREYYRRKDLFLEKFVLDIHQF